MPPSDLHKKQAKTSKARRGGERGAGVATAAIVLYLFRMAALTPIRLLALEQDRP